ncbi:MAG: hypothetical protein HN337_04005, partial [Deltaproteobacteria bacterium]|nr:hypothetical protein [Deltaproteobacteria bacterium]
VNTSTFFIVPTPTSSNLAAPTKAEYDETICDVTNALESSVSCDSVTECTLDPTDDLSTGTSYTACVSPNIEYAAGGNFEGVSFTFTTTGDPAIPDVSGLYSTSDNDCWVSSLLQASSTVENEYSFIGDIDSATLTMTDSNSCTITDIVNEDETITVNSCSYESSQFTLAVATPEGDCSVILTKSDAECGNGECEYTKGEDRYNCPDDCTVTASSISFIGDKNWSTTSPNNDCLSVATGTTNFPIPVDPTGDGGELPESYIYSSFGGGENGYYIRISREEDDTVDLNFNDKAGDSENETYIEDCLYISACNTNQISAVCELQAGGYCNIDLE